MLRYAGLLVSVLLVGGGVIVGGSDQNWGKKTKCFMVDGTVVCPGCNSRAGLTCPRSLKNSMNCLEPSSTQQPWYRNPSTPEKTTLAQINEINSTETTYEEINATQAVSASSTVANLNETVSISTTTISPVSIALYLSRLLGRQHLIYRYKRGTEQINNIEVEDDREICNWNGDCPCPQICCQTGPGCPKRCVMGITLPPPWG